MKYGFEEGFTLAMIESAISNGEKSVLFRGRNLIERIRTENLDFTIKHFGRSWIHSIIYAIRTSKARRSFINAGRLKALGVHTPQPMMWGEERNLLQCLGESIYVCEYEEAFSLADLIDSAEKKEVIDGFARFVAMLHEKGIVHRDLNNTNVRVVKNADNSYSFSLIDINRITFYDSTHPAPLDVRFKNLCRFSVFDETFNLFAPKYLAYSGLDARLLTKLNEIKLKHERHTARKKRFKRLFKKKK